ncbi:MAG: flagellar biosynthesis anti-sigma factor FlgM [Nitrospinae bacterium]|nr:flagellar biosynthesis anti-sigma factor FlgM [Nitrospinota bacterium]MBI3814885.1 flagellar biosynthesis anti-sigma factor FlgM [Nitrospinota bacterium]
MKTNSQINKNKIRKKLVAKYRKKIKNNLYQIKSMEIAEKIAQRLKEETRA